MKLTICQIAKLFLLLTAFFFLNSPSAASLALGSNPTSLSSHSFRPETVLVLQAAKTAADFATTPATKSTAATRPSSTTAAATTLSSNSIWPTATQTKSPRNARGPERQKRQKQQPAAQQQQQQRHLRPQEQQGQQRQGRQQQHQDQNQRMAVLIPSSLHADMTHVQQGFQNFLDFFQLHLSNVSVDFLRDVGE
ncbi:hypothetical protein KR084_009382, partial [Drosophila pseudotakahashii]